MEMEVTRFISSHFLMGIKNGENTYCKPGWFLNSFLHSIESLQHQATLSLWQVVLFKREHVRQHVFLLGDSENKCSYFYVQNLDGLLIKLIFFLYSAKL